MPGAQKVLGQHASSENPQSGLQINNNGQNFGATNFMIDGTDNNDPVLGIIIVNPAIDSVQEYKYTTGNYDAEFAQAGGAVIQVETKSGTNQIHGSLFEFVRNNNFNARNPFSEPNGPPQLKWNQFGVSLLNSGLAITPTLVSNAAINSDVSGVSLRPDRVTGVDPYDVPGGQSRDQWFNLGAYRVPGLYQFGTSSRGQLRGPGLVELNYSLSKRFGLGEAKSLQLRWEMFNAINRTNLANPNTSIDSGTVAAARITGLVVTATMRQMQLGARIEF